MSTPIDKMNARAAHDAAGDTGLHGCFRNFGPLLVLLLAVAIAFLYFFSIDARPSGQNVFAQQTVAAYWKQTATVSTLINLSVSRTVRGPQMTETMQAYTAYTTAVADATGVAGIVTATQVVTKIPSVEPSQTVVPSSTFVVTEVPTIVSTSAAPIIGTPTWTVYEKTLNPQLTALVRTSNP